MAEPHPRMRCTIPKPTLRKELVSDGELIKRIRAGDDTAWTALVEMHQQPVFRLAYLLLGDADEAEDAAQEALIRAFRSLDAFDAARPLRPWLLQIVANVARNRRRSIRRYVAALGRVWQAQGEPSAPLGDRSGERWEAQTLWQAVRRLSRSDQEVIFLRFFLELGEAETAATLGVAAGTVKSRLHRALGRLRGVVEREFPALRQERET